MTEQHIVKWHVIKKTYVENRINNNGFYGNQYIFGLALYLKMFVLVTSISVPDFMLVSKKAQFT